MNNDRTCVWGKTVPLSMLRFQSTVMKLCSPFEPIEVFDKNIKKKTAAHYNRAFAETSRTTHLSIIIKRRCISSPSENSGYFNGSYREYQNQEAAKGGILFAPSHTHRVLRHHFLFLEKARWPCATVFTYSTSWVELVCLLSEANQVCLSLSVCTLYRFICLNIPHAYN